MRSEQSQLSRGVNGRLTFFLSAEDLPDQNNRVELRGDGSIRLVYTRNNDLAYEQLLARCKQALTDVQRLRGKKAPLFLHSRLGISGTSHQNGTLRFGDDPRTSVLDLSCKAHDLDNLYAVDASFFPSCGAVNPSLTIIANAIRVGEIIAARFNKQSTVIETSRNASVSSRQTTLVS